MFNIKKYNEILAIIKNTSKNTQIIGISKNQPKVAVLSAISHGLMVFGENRVQEAQEKFSDIVAKNPRISIHLTGPLQSNKVKQALKLFDVFHTLDREKLVNELVKYPSIINKKKFFIQVNTGKEDTKSGIFPEEAEEFLNYCKERGINNIIGLMCIPPVDENPKDHFLMLREIGSKISIQGLSIGMSSDFLDAIELNATFIRLGSILFGSRR